MDAIRDKMAENAAKSFDWYIILIQVIAIAILAGSVGTVSGLITASILRKKATAPAA